MHRGYVKLWRKCIETKILKNPKLFTFWIWCLLKASHREKKIMVGFQEVILSPGQFVFGRRKASEELGLTQQTIRTCIKTLQNSENLTIKSTNKFSIISITNWDIYQEQEPTTNQQTNKRLTSKQPTSNQQVTTNKNDKNEKNDNNIKQTYPWLDFELWKDFRKHRQKLKAPLTDRAEKILLDKLNKSSGNGNNSNEYIKQSIERGWKGVFPEDKTQEPKSILERQWKPKPRI